MTTAGGRGYILTPLRGSDRMRCAQHFNLDVVLDEKASDFFTAPLAAATG